MRENLIEAYLKRRVEALGGACYKWISPGVSGVPDRIVIMPDGKVYFIELKAPGKKPTALQLRVHARLSSLKQSVHVLDSMEAVGDFVETL